MINVPVSDKRIFGKKRKWGMQVEKLNLITSPITERTFSLADLRQPRLFLWEIASFADDTKLGAIDTYRCEPGVWQPGREESLWKAWTQYDFRGAFPAQILPDRFYLATSLRSLVKIGDFSGNYDLMVKVASREFVSALEDAGQTEIQVIPLTVWRRAESDCAPTPEINSNFVALYCWRDPSIFDIDQSSLQEIELGKYGGSSTNDMFDPIGSRSQKVYGGTWQHLALKECANKTILPPLYRISRVGGRRYISPQFVKILEQRKMNVSLVKRYIDMDREWAIGAAFQQGLLDSWPPEEPLGADGH
jgi:hypothetical protein